MAEEIRWEEGMLDGLARTMVFPATPDMRVAVLGRLAEAPRARRPAFGRLALAVVAVLAVVSAAVVLTSRDAREAVADFLGLSVQGERIEILPTPRAGTTATPFPSPVTVDQIADRISREEAVRRTGIQPVLPASLREPEAFYGLRGNFPIVIADYGAIEIWEMAYEGEFFIGKGFVGGGELLEEVTVNGVKGYWIRGGARIVTVNNATGTPVSGTQRTVISNALIWSSGGLYRRIEGLDSLEAALSLAAEMP